MKIKYYAFPITILSLITVPTVFFYGGVAIGRYLPKPTPSPVPESILGVNKGPVCQTYGLVINPKVTPPSNFPGLTKSSLLVFSGEITSIVNTRWNINRGDSNKDFIIENTAILDKGEAKNYKVGDCVTLFYGVKKGFIEKVYEVVSQ